MKKISYLFVIITSLFLSFNSVKASTYFDSYIKDFDVINDDFFEVIRQADVILIEKNLDYYYVYYSNGIFNLNFFNEPDSYTSTFSIKDINIAFTNSVKYYWYQFIDNSLVSKGTGSSKLSISISKSSSSETYSFYGMIYTNYYFEWKDSRDYILRYDDYVFTTTLGDQVLSLYDYYLLINPQSDPHEEEKNIILNFYTLIIYKLSFLSESFSSNYIYLSVIVVFILIFIIELIRRHL